MAEIYWPFPTSLVSEWPGTRPVGWANHVGTDFAVTQGTPLVATMAGTVDIHWSDGLGAWVIDLINPDGTVVRNGHMSHMSVSDGQWVNVGDYIGNTGGRPGTAGAGLSTGDHLHWEIRNNREWGPIGWYDPRNLTIKHLPGSGGSKPAVPGIPAPAGQTRKKKTMATLYVSTGNNKRPGSGGNNPTYALAGDSPGTPANWLPTVDVALATEFANVHGKAVWLTKATFADYERRYKGKVATS